MRLSDVLGAAQRWSGFTARTVGYATVSIALGPLTPDRKASLWATREWCRSAARGLNIVSRFTGLENIPPAPYVYCCNPPSLLDILVLGGQLPGDYRWAAKRELQHVPFLGWHLWLAGHVFVDRRGGRTTAAQTAAKFEAVLAAGKPLLLFPEGTRSPDGVLQPFKKGGFFAAVRANVPVVPIAIDGTHELMHKGAADAREDESHVVRVRVGRPILPVVEGTDEARAGDLRDRSYVAVYRLLESIGGKLPQRPAVDLGAFAPDPS